MKQILARKLYKVAVSMKKIASVILPVSVMQRIKTYLLQIAFPIKNKNSTSVKIENTGINLIGYSRAEMGIGESCRIAARSLSAGELPFAIINFEGTSRSRMNDLSFIHKEVDSPIYDINVFHINAEQMVEIYTQFGETIFEERYNIGYWHWELPDFPDRWTKSFGFVNEIWAPSTFVAEALAMKSPVPVVRIPHSIEVKIDEHRERSYFNLPEESFLFMAMYDVNSYHQRKNPQAVIEAFKTTFERDDMSVGLVLKVNVTDPNSIEMKQLQALNQGSRNIYLIKDVLTRNDVNALLSVCDSFISLHRSEGFGLGLAEAMFLGKPVIGTDWSANTDFMSEKNSCPVRYNLVKLGETYGPYEDYQYWADPDIDHASIYMKRLLNDKYFREKIALEGQLTIRNEFSPKRVSELIKKRLKYIGQWNSSGG